MEGKTYYNITQLHVHALKLATLTILAGNKFNNDCCNRSNLTKLVRLDSIKFNTTF